MQFAALTLKMVTAVMGSAVDSGIPAGLKSVETTGMPATRTDISGESITMAISLVIPGPSSASTGACLL